MEVTKIEEVELDKMALDMSYQRQERNTVRKIIKNFDPRLLRPLVVSYRDGKYYIVDGQHRYQALKMMGVTKTRCEVFYGLSSKEEAEIFSRQNNNVATLKPIDTFKSNIHIGNPTDIDVIIYNIIMKNKMLIANNPKALGFRCLYSLRNGVRLYGADILEFLCEVILGLSWASCKDAYARDFQESLMNLYKRSASSDLVIQKLKNYSPEELVRGAIIKYGDSKQGNISRYLEFIVLSR